MAEKFDLIAEIREDSGKGSSRRLRRAGKVPAIIYGAGKEPRSLVFDHNAVLRAVEHESFFSSVLTIQVDGKARPSILKDLQMHPSKRQVMHLDLQRIVADQEIRMTVPLHFLNESIAVGVKQGGGIVSHIMAEVEVSCLPKDLPEYLEVDIAALELDEMLHLSDIKLPAGVELMELAAEPPRDHAIVSIHVPRAVEEPEDEEAADAEAEAAEAKAGDSEDEGEGKDKDKDN